jgi:hypothetical protein
VRGDDAAALHVYAQVLLQQRLTSAQNLSRETGLQGKDQAAKLYQQEAAAISQLSANR